MDDKINIIGYDGQQGINLPSFVYLTPDGSLSTLSVLKIPFNILKALNSESEK
jgi:hypothetical protein